MLVASKLAAEAGFAASGFRVVANAGPDAGQSVPTFTCTRWPAAPSVGRRGSYKSDRA